MAHSGLLPIAMAPPIVRKTLSPARPRPPHHAASSTERAQPPMVVTLAQTHLLGDEWQTLTTFSYATPRAPQFGIPRLVSVVTPDRARRSSGGICVNAWMKVPENIVESYVETYVPPLSYDRSLRLRTGFALPSTHPRLRGELEGWIAACALLDAKMPDGTVAHSWLEHGNLCARYLFGTLPGARTHLAPDSRFAYFASEFPYRFSLLTLLGAFA